VWIVRQLVRLLARVAALVGIAGIAAVVALLRSDHGMHIFRVTLIVAGCIIAALGAMGAGSSYQRAADLRTARWTRYWSGGVAASQEPQLAAGPTLVVAGAIALALGFFV
jgi:hypothetical protein